MQNYPNPFNPSTSIKYSVPDNSIVTLAIYDLLGKHIKTLVNEKTESGKNETFWNGKNTSNNYSASGVYVFSLFASTADQIYSFAKKMILLR